MENQPPAKPRREEAAAAGSIMGDEDRISQLPGLIFDHILSFLPQNVAVRTCLISKSWRHLGPTRPKIEFHQSDFPESGEKFLSVVENTLQRYDDQKISIQEFVLSMLKPDDSDEPRNSNLLFDKWIPIVLSKKGLKKFKLSAHDFPLPLNVVFEAESLEELFLKGCNFNSPGKVRALSHLRTLSLDSVLIEEADFEKIMSSCPLVQHLVLHQPCMMSEWFHLHNNYFFPRLKSLFLSYVQLPREWLNNLPSSSNNNCLRTLSLGSVRIEEETFEKIMNRASRPELLSGVEDY